MGELVLQLKNQSLELWQKFTRTQKIIIVASAVGIILALVLFARGAAQPDYRPLFGEKLEPDQAGAIVEKLKELKIPYQLSEGGDTILVPAKDLAETRLAIARDDKLPMGGVVGFEAFDQPRFGETETDRQAKFLRALQGELTRTIEQMDEVEKARVHIVLPRPTLFSEDEKAATAAIVLKLAPNKTLDESQVAGLIKLVASSVEGLDPRNVTIVDTNSNILSDAYDPEGTDLNSRNKLTQTQLQLQQQYQKEVQRSVQSMLERVLGPGKAVVRVNAQLDFDNTKERSETLGQPKVVSQHKLEEISEGENGNASGVPGVTSNDPNSVPGYQGSTTGKSRYEKNESTVNNEFDRQVRETIKAPGDVKKLSVAVVLDGNFTPARLKNLEGLVVSAAGLDEKRGDQVSVVGMPFETSSMDEISKAMAAEQKQQQQILYGIIAAALLLPAAALVVYLLRKHKLEQEEAAVALGQALTVDQLLAAQEEPEEEAETEAEPEPEIDPVELEKANIRNQVEKVAKERPEEVARLLKTWLVEE